MVKEARSVRKMKTMGEKAFTLFNIVFLCMISILCIYPILYILFASLSNPNLLVQHEGLLLSPLGFTLDGYRLTLDNPNIGTGYYNTLIYVVFSTLISMILTCMGAYALSRKNVFFSKYVMIMITITMFFGGGLIPYYLLVVQLGLYNTRWAILLPGALSTWNLIIMRTSFMGIPDSLIESAKLDGANDFVILSRIVLPVSKAVTSVIGLFYAVGMWNSWFGAAIFLQNRSLFPLQLILREILIINDKSQMLQINMVNPKDESSYRMLVQYTTIIVATVPVLFIYPFLQKYFVKGVMIGSLKG